MPTFHIRKLKFMNSTRQSMLNKKQYSPAMIATTTQLVIRDFVSMLEMSVVLLQKLKELTNNSTVQTQGCFDHKLRLVISGFSQRSLTHLPSRTFRSEKNPQTTSFQLCNDCHHFSWKE